MSLLRLLKPPVGTQARLEMQRGALFRLACMWCHDRSLADDLTQEALTKALARRHQLRDETRLRSWLYGILANCWRDHLRARRPMEDIDAIPDERLAVNFTPEDALSQAQLGARVRAAVAALPIGQREVLALVDLGDSSYAEVAEILAIPIGTVMSRLSRGRAALRDRLEETQGVERPGSTLRRMK